jgi:hypothetical protein
MMGMAAVFAQLEREVIIDRTRAALRTRVELMHRGESWRKKDGTVATRVGRPPSIPAPVAGLVREFASDEWSPQQIADFLNAACVPTPRGGACWRPSSLTAVLQ